MVFLRCGHHFSIFTVVVLIVNLVSKVKLNGFSIGQPFLVSHRALVEVEF